MTGQQLKNSILQMAVQGKLVPQDPNDETGFCILERIRKEKEQLIKEGKIKKEKSSSYIFRGADNLLMRKSGKMSLCALRMRCRLRSRTRGNGYVLKVSVLLYVAAVLNVMKLSEVAIPALDMGKSTQRTILHLHQQSLLFRKRLMKNVGIFLTGIS